MPGGSSPGTSCLPVIQRGLRTILKRVSCPLARFEKMPGMRRSVRQKVISGAAVAVLLGGACFAAVSAVGQGNGHERAGARHLHPRDIEAAAAYLGVSSQQLAREAQSKSLAQVAEAHSGKSAEGLTEAIIASRRARLQKLAARLPGRVRAEVSRPARGAAA